MTPGQAIARKFHLIQVFPAKLEQNSVCVRIRHILFKRFGKCEQKAVCLLFQSLFTQIPIFLYLCDKLLIIHVKTPLEDTFRTIL